MRPIVYVDGFNQYYVALKRTNFKWLNPVELIRLVLPRECVVDRLLFFTAWVSGVPDENAPIRQQTYVNALNTLPEAEVHFGSFLAKAVWRPFANLPIAGRRIVRVDGGPVIGRLQIHEDDRFGTCYFSIHSARVNMAT